jgi:hypothetical protein
LDAILFLIADLKVDSPNDHTKYDHDEQLQTKQQQ